MELLEVELRAKRFLRFFPQAHDLARTDGVRMSLAQPRDSSVYLFRLKLGVHGAVPDPEVEGIDKHEAVVRRSRLSERRGRVHLEPRACHFGCREASARALTSRSNSITSRAVAPGRLLYARNMAAGSCAIIIGLPIRAATVKMTSRKAAGSP